MLKRRDAVIICQIDVGPGIYEELHNIDMTLAAVAEHDGFEECRPAKIVDVIDLDASLDQRAYRFDMSAFGGGNECGSAIAIGALQISTVRKRHLENFEVSACARIKIGAVLDGILGIDVGASINERTGDIDVIGMGCRQKCRLAILAPRFEVCSGLDGCIDRRQIASRCGLKKRRFGLGLGCGVVARQCRFGHNYRPCNQCQGTQAEYCLTHRLVLLLVAFIQAGCHIWKLNVELISSGFMNTSFNLDLLRAFVAVVDSRSFTAAALQLHSTQSTISQKIIRLEEAVGQALLERARHDVRPTDAGEKLLGYARRILHLHDEAAAAMTGTALAAVFRLGLPEDFASRLVTPALARFMRAHPNTKLEVTSGLSRDLQKGFETGEFDLVMVKQKRGETVGTMHWPEPLSWLDSADFSVSHVDPLPLVVFPPNGLYRSDMMEALDRVGRRWHVVFTSSSLASIQSAVAEGLGVSLLPTRVALPGHQVVPAAAGLPSVEPMEIVIRHMDNGPEQIRLLAEMLAEIVGD